MADINSNQIGKIKGFYETSMLDWRGRISSVIFLAGCNLRCPYCHNYELVLKPQLLPDIPWTWIENRIKGFADWIDGLVISGGEPCLFSNLHELISFFRPISIPIKLDTNGTKPCVLESLIKDELIDYVAMDVKAPLDESSYSRCTGVHITPDEMRKIKKSLSILVDSDIPYELRMTVCPSLINQHDIEILANELKGFKGLKGIKKFILQNFSPRKTLDSSLAGQCPYPHEQLFEFKKILDDSVEECIVI